MKTTTLYVLMLLLTCACSTTACSGESGVDPHGPGGGCGGAPAESSATTGDSMTGAGGRGGGDAVGCVRDTSCAPPDLDLEARCAELGGGKAVVCAGSEGVPPACVPVGGAECGGDLWCCP